MQEKRKKCKKMQENAKCIEFKAKQISRGKQGIHSKYCILAVVDYPIPIELDLLK